LRGYSRPRPRICSERLQGPLPVSYLKRSVTRIARLFWHVRCPSGATFYLKQTFGLQLQPIPTLLVGRSSTESTVRKLEVLHAKADEWAKKYTSVFATAKYELICFIYKWDRRHIRDKTRVVDLGPTNGVEGVIQPKTYPRYLGIILDLESNDIKYTDI
jgi:hypothetical protein